MPFDWMTGNARAGGASRKTLYEQEVRDRAALLRRLGHPKAYAKRRCVGNLEEEFSSFGASPLLKKEVDAVLAQVYG